MARKKRGRKILVWFILIVLFLSIAALMYFGVLQSIFQQPYEFRMYSMCGCGCSYYGFNGWNNQPAVTVLVNDESLRFGANTGLYHNNQWICSRTAGPQVAGDCTSGKPTNVPQEVWEHYSGGGITNDAKTVFFRKLTSVAVCSKTTSCPGGAPCYSHIVGYRFDFSNNAFEFNVSYPLTSYMVGENITLTVTVQE